MNKIWFYEEIYTVYTCVQILRKFIFQRMYVAYFSEISWVDKIWNMSNVMTSPLLTLILVFSNFDMAEKIYRCIHIHKW